ncbi:MAG: 16S rRNA (cytosine(967)-C(5))-methyltransferase RsmB [Blautia sp.]
MINGMNTREIILAVLLQVEEDEVPCHIAIRNALSKYQFLPKQDRAFITRICEGTLEYRIQIDYIIDYFSKVKVEKMKAPIREILRSAVYQLKYMDSVPESAVCNEAVKLAQKKGFYNLKPFVNGVLRTIVRRQQEVVFPSREEDEETYFSVRYSMPIWLVKRWIEAYGSQMTEKMLESFLEEKPTTIRCRLYRTSMEETLQSLRDQGVTVEKAPYLDYAYYISGYNHILTLDAFREGKIQVQDVSSMLVAEAASPRRSSYVIDLCAAPGGKSLHIADKMEGYGTVDARDLTEAKVELIRENIQRAEVINVHAKCQDATLFDLDSEDTADIVLADVPCSGYGVIGRKPDIKYRMTLSRQEEIVILQRTILDKAVKYVRKGGTLIFSTCTIAREENEDNVQWLLENYPLELESLDPYLPEELHCETTAQGWLQLLPGVHKCDGFFLARFRRK